MKRIGNIYQKIIDKDNIRAAIKRAATGKLKRESVQRVLADIPRHVDKIHVLLKNKAYRPCPVKERIVREGACQKERKITTIRFFPDQIIHWCVILQLESYFIKSAYQLSCGSMPGRGVHYAKKFVVKWLQNDRKNTKYIAKLDIAKFYPSIPHEAVKVVLRRKFKDADLIWLLDTIVGHWCRDRQEQVKRGLPIGFLTSQWLANFLLQPTDFYIKQRLGVRYYVRYMDDMILFGRNKKELHKSVKAIADKLRPLGLVIKKNWQVFRSDSRPLDFMGFRFYCDRVTLRRSLMLRITRTCRHISKKHSPTRAESSGVLSYMGWLINSDSHNLYNSRVKPFVNIKRAKRCVSLAAIAANLKAKELTHENSAV
jgi:RNA-directed DNA polymerase